MGQEIERKFLLKNTEFLEGLQGEHILQGYIFSGKGKSVRVRTVGRRGYITVKASKDGFSRHEFEYEIPYQDVLKILEHICEKPIIDKHRYEIDYGLFTWEIDVFHGENDGLIVAEIELDWEDQEFPLPDWVGEEVTGDHKYTNSNLVENPYKSW